MKYSIVYGRFADKFNDAVYDYVLKDGKVLHKVCLWSIGYSKPFIKYVSHGQQFNFFGQYCFVIVDEKMKICKIL